MRIRKTKTELNNNDFSNGNIKTSLKTKKRSQNNQQLLVYVLFGFFGLIFACGFLIFITVDLRFDDDVYGRTKTKVAEDSERSKRSNQGRKETYESQKQKESSADIKRKESYQGEAKLTKSLKDTNVIAADNQNESKVTPKWREADENVLAKFGTTICNIERRKSELLSEKEFETKYRYKKPVIVQFPNGPKDWTDPEKWTISSLKKEYGNYTIYSGNAREIVRRGGNGEVGSSFSDFVDKLILKEDETGEPFYVFDRNFYNSSSLPKTLKPPEYFRIQDEVDDSIFFLGASRSGVAFHKHADSWNGVIFGRKRWFLYPIEHTPPGGVFTGYTMLEWYDKIYPKLKATSDKPFECIQEAGEILYLPEGFYHGTINLGDTVAIGIQKKESTLEIQRLFYEDRQLYRMLEKSTTYEDHRSWTQKIIDLYTKILHVLPGNTEVMNHLAVLYSSMEKSEDSMAMVDKALKKDPYFIMALLHKAELLQKQNKHLEAEEVYQEALILNPDLFDSRLHYGNFLYNTGRPEEAVFHFKRATDLRPNEISFWNHLKNAQIASGDDEGAQQTDLVIDYLQNHY